jgi:hypothetical protein
MSSSWHNRFGRIPEFLFKALFAIPLAAALAISEALGHSPTTPDGQPTLVAWLAFGSMVLAGSVAWRLVEHRLAARPRVEQIGEIVICEVESEITEFRAPLEVPDWAALGTSRHAPLATALAATFTLVCLPGGNSGTITQIDSSSGTKSILIATREHPVFELEDEIE